MSNLKKGINFRNAGRALTQNIMSAAAKKVVKPLGRAITQGITKPVKQKIVKPIVDNVLKPIRRVTKPAELKRIGRQVVRAAERTVDTLHGLHIFRTINDSVPRATLIASREIDNKLGRGRGTTRVLSPIATAKLRSAIELAGRKRGLVWDSPNSNKVRAEYDATQNVTDLRSIASAKNLLETNIAEKTAMQNRNRIRFNRGKKLLRLPETFGTNEQDQTKFFNRLSVALQQETQTPRTTRKARMPTSDSDIRNEATNLLERNNFYTPIVEGIAASLGVATSPLGLLTLGGAAVKSYATDKINNAISDAQLYAGDKVKRVKNYINPPSPASKQATQYTLLPKSIPQNSSKVFYNRTPGVIDSDERLEQWSLPRKRIKTTAPKPVTKMMGGKSGRMGKELEGADGVKGRYFEKGAVQGRTAKFYETDKPHAPQMRTLTKAQVSKLQTKKFYEINNANYYGEEKMQKPNTFRKNNSIGNSVNMGGGINGYLGTSGMGRKQMMNVAQPRQKLPSPMNGPAQRSTTFKPMGGSLNTFNPYPRSGSMATGMGAPTMKRMNTPRKRGFN